MSSKSGTKSIESSLKQVVSKCVTSASSSAITSQNNSGFPQQRVNIRATSAKYYDIASTILGGSGDVEELFLNSAKNGNCRKLEQLLQQRSEIGLNINCADKRTGNTALIWSSKRGHTKVAELLLRYGADATVCNYEAHTALETAFSPVKTIILDWVETQEELNERLLLQAAWQGNLSIVKKILQNRCHINVNCQNVEGLTPLMLVSRDIQLFERLCSQLNRQYNPVQVAEELIKSKADVHVTDSDGRSCLHYAAQFHSGCADNLTVALVSGGFDIELCDKHQLTPLHLASQSGNTSNVIALADRGSNVNAKGFAGLTPLHMTAMKDHHVTALILLKYGAHVTTIDDHGFTPLDMAKSKKMKNSLKEAWLVAKKNSTLSSDTTSISQHDDVVEGMKRSEAAKKSCGVVSNTSKVSMNSQTINSNQSKILSNVDRCRPVERKTLQEMEAFKAANPMLQRETTRVLSTPRTNILPQIRRGSSPDCSSKVSQVNVGSKSPPKGSEVLQRSLEEAQKKVVSRGRSVLDIKLGLGRPSEKSNTGCVNQDHLDHQKDVQKDLLKSVHRRSGSDPTAPHIRDLTASCDTLLACTNGKKNVKLKNTDFCLSRDISTSLIKMQKEPHNSEKDSLHPEGILKSMGSPSEILRSHTILKEDFILEESRPKEVSSSSDPASSISSCSQSSSSPRDISFIQPSPSRSVRHDPSLSTLLEQHASTNFSVSDSFSNTDGKPVILKPHKKLRRRSDNSLSSSLESDVDDLRTDKVITKSDFLRKSVDRACNANQESINLSNPLSVFKSQSMESILPKAQPKVLEDWLASSSVTAKSNSEDNLDTANKDSMQNAKSKSKLCEAGKNKDLTKAQQTAAKCIKPSKKLILEPFIGKTKVVSNTKNENCNNSSSDGLSGENTYSFCHKSSIGNQQILGQGRKKSQQQKSNSAAKVQPVLINTVDSPVSSAEAAKLQPSQAMKQFPVSIRILRSQEQYKSPETLNLSDLTIQSSSGNKKIDDCSSSASLKLSISKQLNPNIYDMLQELVNTKQSHTVDKVCENSHENMNVFEESNIFANTNNQKVEKIEFSDQTKTNEACSMIIDGKKSCEVVQNHIKINTDSKEMPSKIKKKSPTNPCKETSTKLSGPPFNTTESVPIVCSSDMKNSSVTTTKPLDQNITNTSRTETSSKSIICRNDVICTENTQKLSNMHEESKTTLECSRKDDDSSKLTLNILKRFYTPKPNIQLKTMLIEPSATSKVQSIADKMNGDADTKNMNNDFISTPVIVNPFEEFFQAHISVVDNSSTDALIKVKKPNPNKIMSKNVKKATTTLSKKKLNSGILRQVSAGRKQSAKGKDLKIEKELRPKTGRKSAKGQQSKKTERITKSMINVDALISPNSVLKSESDCQLSASHADSVNEVSNDLHLYSSDSDFSLDLDEHVSIVHENDHSKGNHLNKNSIQAFLENTTEDTSMSCEQKNHVSPVFSKNLPEVSSDKLSLFNLHKAEAIHNSLEHEKKTINHLIINEKDQQFSTNISHGQSKSVDDQKDFNLSKINLTPEKSSFNALNTTSAIETTHKDLPLHNDDIILCEMKSQNQNAKGVQVNTEFSQDLDDNPEYHHASCITNDKMKDQMIANYEYTPSGKIVRRSQSLKKIKKPNMLEPKLKFPKNFGQETIVEKAGDNSDDIDDIIEEILSSTTSSVASVTKNLKGVGSCIPGVHTLTENDKNILLKMSSSKFSSPFHARLSANAKEYSEDVVDDLSEGDLSPSSRLSSSVNTEDTAEDIAISEDQHLTMTAKEVQNHGYVAVFPTSKPPQPFCREFGAPKTVTVRRTSSDREGRRRQINSKNGVIVTEREAQQLVKILSSLKNMELQVGTNCVDSRNTLGSGDQNSVSFRSKGMFQEIKANARTRISTEFMEAPSAELSNRVADNRDAVEDMKYDGGNTIQWKKGNILGRGAFGTVWCGLTNEGQLIAVKQIELTTVNRSKAQHEYKNVQMEVEILKTLEHDNIVSYLGTSLEDNIVSIFMQYIPGGSIASILARFGALEESVFRIYTKQILEGVKYLHSNDVIHRDIKGANVMVMHNGVIKLIDFGCAKRLCFNLSISQSELLMSMNGTPYWMAPEVVNESGHGKKSDIWSIGCTVFEMATIKPPWADMNPMAAIFAIGSPSRPVPTLGSKFSHDARDFVSRCMTRDQDARPGASELQEHPFVTRLNYTRPARSDD